MKLFALFALAALTALAAPGLIAQPVYNVVAEVALAHPEGQPEAWLITDFTAQGVVAEMVNASYEPPVPALLAAIKKKLNEPRLALPIALENLSAILQSRDPTREWLPAEIPAPHPGYQFILLRYRNRAQAFAVELHLEGEDAAAPTATLALSGTAASEAHYRPTASLDAAVLKDAIAQAAAEAQTIAREQGLVPGGATGNTTAIRDQLAGHFVLEGVRVAAQDYRVGVSDGRATLLVVQPVFVPKEIAVELGNWAQEEDETKWDAPSIERLRKKRHEREAAIRQELAGVLPAPASLITQPLVTGWQQTDAGKRYSLAPVRYADDVLVLSAVDDVERNDYIATVGASYGETDGLQGTASVHVIHDRRVHFDFTAEGSYGTKADSAGTTLQWSPHQPVAGWKLDFDGSLETHRSEEAYFGDATGTTPVEWRRWRGNAGLSASHGTADPVAIAGQWPARFNLALQLGHTDDQFAVDAAGLPAEAGAPDSFLEFKAGWRTVTLLAAGRAQLSLGAQLRLAQALTGLDGHYDYQLAEGQMTASLLIGAAPHQWKIAMTTRAGRINAAAPSGSLFRAGGDQGWIRGLSEGELTGRDYWAQSLAAGPEVTSLFGEQSTGGLRAFLLAFSDFGRVTDVTGARHSAQGYGVAVNLDRMPVGDTTADLSLGYAYSPDSRVDRHGAVFVRLDFPFGN